MNAQRRRLLKQLRAEEAAEAAEQQQADVGALTANDDSNSERQAGRHNPKVGFSAAAQEVIKESDQRRQRFEDHVRDHGYER